MFTMPAHADPLAFVPFVDAAINRVDASRDFVIRYARILNSGPHPLFDEHIAGANAAEMLGLPPNHAQFIKSLTESVVNAYYHVVFACP